VYVARRLLAAIPTLFFISIVVFGLLHLLPGDAATAAAGPNATLEEIEVLREQMGLNRPLVIRYGEWLGRLLVGDLGTSLRDGRPISELIARRLPVSLELGFYALMIALIIGIPAGIFAATHRNSAADTMTISATIINISLPTFLLGLLLIYVVSLRLRWLPAGGYVPITEDPLEHWKLLILPAIAHAGGTIALMTRVTRSSSLDTLNEDYVRTARAKGLKESRLLRVHAFRNALLPIITIAGIHAGYLLGGAVISETIFTIPGMGSLMVEALLSRDYPVVQAALLVYAVLFVVLNLLVDVSYGIFDPRVRHG
jgi:peptide/nickel transport system permease protein